VKPSASSSILNNTASTEISKLTRKDFIVLWYGSNDISNNKATLGVKNILHFVMNNLHSNIIVVNVPHRYDLPMSSCVNREVSLFNKKLEKCLKSLNCVSLIATDCFRENFTKHGMHLNSLGKSNVSRQIVKCIHTMINKEVKAPIKLDWRTEYDTVDSDVIEMGSTYASPVLGANTVDKCTRRKPITRSSDFLWGD
jgi:hypothetical protein